MQALRQALQQSMDGALLTSTELVQVLNNVQKFDEAMPATRNAVSQLLSSARHLSFKVNPTPLKKINKPVLLLIASVVVCAILLIWNNNTPAKTGDVEIPSYVVSDTITADTLSRDRMEETPNQVYQRITTQSAATNPQPLQTAKKTEDPVQKKLR